MRGGNAGSPPAEPAAGAGAAPGAGTKCAKSAECTGNLVCIAYTCQAPPAEGAQAAAAGGACPSGGGRVVSRGMASLAGGRLVQDEVQERGVDGRPLRLDQSIVTADAFAACVKAGQCTVDPAPKDRDDSWGKPMVGCTHGASGKGKHPMNCVTWGESVKYCRAQGKRLLTGEEWRGARRRRGPVFPWGEEPKKDQGCPCVEHRVVPGGAYPAGDAPGHIHDLLGNVAQWTSSKCVTSAATTVRPAVAAAGSRVRARSPQHPARGALFCCAK